MVNGRREEMAHLSAIPPLWAPYPISPALKWAGYFAAGTWLWSSPDALLFPLRTSWLGSHTRYCAQS